jgi:sigma-B regulation protein RsbU (phosphoserine phosphatase)
MGLKARIGVIVIGFMAVMVAGLVFAANLREQALRDQLDRTARTGSRALWGKIVETGVQRMRERAPVVTQNQALRAALESGDPGEISQAAQVALGELRDTGDVTRLDLVSPTKEVLYSSMPAFAPAAAASDDALARMIERGWTGGGVAIDAERNVTLSVGVPLYDEDGATLAVAVYATDILEALTELKADTGAEALIVNRRGRLLVGTDPEVWERIGGTGGLAGSTSEPERSGDQVFSRAAFPLEAELGNLVASVVTVQDVSAVFADQRRVSLITALAGAGFVLASLVGLTLYLRSALSRLTDGVVVLDALSRGDTQASVAVSEEESDDEVARIARAVNTFRTQTLALRRHRRRALLRRRQQERFIHGEMTRLADTLNEEERRDILKDLAEVQAPGGAADTDGTGDHEGGNELQMIGLAFQKMTSRVGRQQQRLTTLVAQLQEALRTKTAYMALQRDLQIASRVQRSFLPGERFEAPGVKIQAAMHPAKEVGGDFYDFFLLDENRIGVVVGDVAGKGVPASMFMAVTRTVIRATARQVEHGPGECLRVVNDTLVEATGGDMFVTVFYGVYDVRDGSFVYANGGHNSPVLVTRDGVERIPLTGGVALAMFDGLTYEEGLVTVPPGCKLFLYTDGVPESADMAEEEYGYERMEEILRQSADRSTGDTLVMMLRSIEEFAGEAAQFDDITMVVLDRNTAKDRIAVRRFSLRNNRADLPRIAEEIRAFAESGGIGSSGAEHLQQALEETMANAIDDRLSAVSEYEIAVRAILDGGVAEVTVEDDGGAYDPMEEPEDRVRDPGREPGESVGLGAGLMRRSLVDEVSYMRVGERNRLIMRKRVDT